NPARSLEILKGVGFWIYGLHERGQSTLAQTEFDTKTVLVVGAEGEGLRHRTREFCDVLVRIPGGQPGVGSAQGERGPPSPGGLGGARGPCARKRPHSQPKSRRSRDAGLRARDVLARA